ncbi:OLC1v1004066C1 [Oldenlandia corymbosa var. corymbosa]|uniref:RBR-type E3 ubiquitin transferase n=1 Tax=Oldenlandia corymbosa var. corymbosa TaxID=529605 RepID=A0AAV1DDU7_OLDCO|nr:OLC1v1004066C1 [Oldenlandia corymbosa var. corymbosa]
MVSVMESYSKRKIEAQSSSGHGKVVLRRETCVICLEKTYSHKMVSLHHDWHHFRCVSCVKKHAEVKLLEGLLPECPHEGCKSSIKIANCKKILSPKLVTLIEERLKESQIPVRDRIYCPYPKCSNLMSKAEVLKYTRSVTWKSYLYSGFRRCLKCDKAFCVYCKIPWHDRLTCSEYQKKHPYSCFEESKLISLAERHSWRQCIKCSHMIELSAGCYHIKCRCGYQFCYACGVEWKYGKAYCRCPAWNENLIIYS